MNGLARGSTFVVVICSTAVFLIALEITIISVALPLIETAFVGSSRAAVSWVFTAYNIGVASFLLIGGWLAERHGRKRVFLGGLWLFAAGSIAAGVAPTLWLLVAARVVQATGGSLLIPASLALILATVEPAKREAAVGIWGAMAGVAAAVGPTAGALLVDSAGWRFVFLVNVPIAIAAAIAGSKYLEESCDHAISPKVDLVAVPAGALGVGLAVFAIVASGALGWADGRVLGSFAVAALLLAVLVRRTRLHPTPLFSPELIDTQSFSVAGIGTLFFVAGFTGWLVLASTFLVDIWGYSTLRSGLAIAPGPTMMALVAGPAAKWAAEKGHRRVVVAGAVLAAAAVGWWAAMIGDDPNFLVGFLPGTLVLGVGVGLSFPMLTAAAMRDVAPKRFAMGAAGNTTMRQVAMAIGIAVAITIVGSRDGMTAAVSAFRLSWLVSGGFFLSTAMVMGLRYPPAGDTTDTQPKVMRHG